MTGPVTKTCERCRQTFECGGYQCWCGHVGITEAHMDRIAARFQDCLCPCLLASCVDRTGGAVTLRVRSTSAHEAHDMRL